MSFLTLTYLKLWLKCGHKYGWKLYKIHRYHLTDQHCYYQRHCNACMYGIYSASKEVLAVKWADGVHTIHTKVTMSLIVAVVICQIATSISLHCFFSFVKSSFFKSVEKTLYLERKHPNSTFIGQLHTISTPKYENTHTCTIWLELTIHWSNVQFKRNWTVKIMTIARTAWEKQIETEL